MTQGKHTNGPWFVGMDSEWSVDTDGESSFVHIGPETGDPVAIAIVGSAWDQDDELDANARLIAAAPAMLEALRFLRANYDVADVVDPIITKATGEKP